MSSYPPRGGALAPDQTFEAIDSLPKFEMPPPSGDPAMMPWPDGDVIKDRPGGIRLGKRSHIEQVALVAYLTERTGSMAAGR